MSARHETERLEVDELVAALERAWGAIRAHHREVPPVVLVLGTSSARRAARQKLGHFAPARWLPFYVVEAAEPRAEPPAIDDGSLMAELAASAQRLLRSAMLLSWEAAASLSEVLITADGLAGSATDALGTLVHEAAHAIAFQRGIKDTSRQGRYHKQVLQGDSRGNRARGVPRSGAGLVCDRSVRPGRRCLPRHARSTRRHAAREERASARS